MVTVVPAEVVAEFTRPKSKDLLRLMLIFHFQRIVCNAADLLRICQAAKKKVNYRPPEDGTPLKDLETLLKGCGAFVLKASANVVDTELASNVTGQAHKLSNSTELRQSTMACFGEGGATEIWQHLCFVARIRAIHQTVVECAKQLPSFAKFEVVPLDLVQAQRRTDVCFDVACCHIRQLKEHIRFRAPTDMHDGNCFQALKPAYGKKLIIHCEMQLLFYLLKAETLNLSPFTYLGISMRPCYSCAVIFGL